MVDDPMEKMVRNALLLRGVKFTEDGKPGGSINSGLDFHLTDYGVHIEVKQFHSPRIAEQTSRVDNVIVAQGRDAVSLLAKLLCEHHGGSK
jgi:hypothetical protein